MKKFLLYTALTVGFSVLLPQYPPIEPTSAQTVTSDTIIPITANDSVTKDSLETTNAFDDNLKKLTAASRKGKKLSLIAEQESKRRSVKTIVVHKQPESVLYKEPDKSDSISVTTDSTYTEFKVKRKYTKKDTRPFWKKWLGIEKPKTKKK